MNVIMSTEEHDTDGKDDDIGIPMNIKSPLEF
jgi:hypothetical protein